MSLEIIKTCPYVSRTRYWKPRDRTYIYLDGGPSPTIWTEGRTVKVERPVGEQLTDTLDLFIGWLVRHGWERMPGWGEGMEAMYKR